MKVLRLGLHALAMATVVVHPQALSLVGKDAARQQPPQVRSQNYQPLPPVATAGVAFSPPVLAASAPAPAGAAAPGPAPATAASNVALTADYQCIANPSLCTCPRTRVACAVASRDCEAQVKTLGSTVGQAHVDNYLSKFDHPLLNTLQLSAVTSSVLRRLADHGDASGSSLPSVAASCTAEEQQEMADCLEFMRACAESRQQMVKSLKDLQQDTEWMDSHPLTPPGAYSWP
mmetsp:Transcript_70651/g.169302  ORF Transcript_70651/g.169302 Transcript_70651/m.169302 type:complete len:232 (-) Transcript_70651:44-739(-)